jgi:NAD(P)H dehydrogenase (quinone)
MIMVTGANGQLAALTLAELNARGVPAVGASHTPKDGQRHLDFDDPGSLNLKGVSTLVLVSAGYAEDDQVVARHQAVLDAAARDGVAHIVYTSLTSAGDHLGFALAHRATERLLKSGGLTWTILRNGLYAELFGALLTWTSDGPVSAFGAGGLSAVARADLAAAAAIVAASPTAHAGQTYDLVGEPFTAEDIAARLGTTHHTIGLSEYRARLLADDALVPFQPPMLISIATSVRHGFLDNTGPDLAGVLDRPFTDSLDVAAAAAAAIRSGRHACHPRPTVR